MNDHTVMVLRAAALTVASAALPGCMNAAIAVFSPAMNAAMEASLTPEAVGISTSAWRGRSCSELEKSYASMLDSQQQFAVAGDTSMVKTSGWQLEVISQVQREQGCLGGIASVPASGQVAAYGYCFAVTDTVNYLTPMFTYNDFYSDGGAAESAAFNAMLRSTYGVEGDRGGCLMEDSPANAATAIERQASITNLQINWDTVRVDWAPPQMEKAAKMVAVSASTPLSSTPTTNSSIDSMGLGLILESPSADLVNALGLKSTAGAWVVSVVPNSAAAKAGIKPMDVIQDVSGQLVSEPSDVIAIAGKLRSGYKAPLGVWRNRANHELVLAIPTRVGGSVANSDVVAEAPKAPANRVTTASLTPQSVTLAGALYCTAVLTTQNTDDATASPVKLIAGAASDIKISLNSYIAKVKQEQPGVWGEFTINTTICAPGALVCMAEAKGPTGKTQNAFEFCHTTQAKADAELKEMRRGGPKVVFVAWP